MAGTSSDAETARKTWEIENEIETLPASDEIFRYDAPEQQQFLSARKLTLNLLIGICTNNPFDCIFRVGPWEKDPHYFKDIQISALALLKMVMHARSGGSLEIMGLLLGKVVENTMVSLMNYFNALRLFQPNTFCVYFV